MLRAAEAARYCGIPVRRFKQACRIAPTLMGEGLLRYDIKDLDEWLDSFRAPGSNDADILDRLG